MDLKLLMEVMSNQDRQTTEKANPVKIGDAKSRIYSHHTDMVIKIARLPKKANLAGAKDAKLWV